MSLETRARAWLILIGGCAGSLPLAGAPSVPALPEIPPQSQPGVRVAFTSALGGARDFRHDRLFALAVPAGSSPSALLPAGPFRADFEADLAVPLRGNATFSFAGTGAAELAVNGRIVLSESGPQLGAKPSDAIQLNKGANQIRVRYTSPSGGGDARFRLLWAGEDFPAEPIPPTTLSADISQLPLREAARIRTGRELFASLQCASCHDPGPLSANAMPELAERAPSLAAAGSRFRRDWISAWILDPKSLRADARMPRVSLGSAGDAADIAAFLASLGTPTNSAAPAAAMVTGGGHLFSELRCNACHTPPGAAPRAADSGRVSLGSVAAKWQPAALQDYLRDPRRLNESARMPDFHLAAGEAAQLSAFLLAGPAAPSQGTAGDSTRGRTLFNQSCQVCHDNPVAGASRNAPRATSSAPSVQELMARDWTRGCVADTPGARGRAPDFGFDPAQREALRAFAASGVASLQRDAPVEAGARAFDTLRCAACHDRDGRPSTSSSLVGETRSLDRKLGGENREGPEVQSLDENPPPLTWAGEKLKSPWLQRQVAGTLQEPARPWLKLRMPGFGDHRASTLARGLALEHGEFLTGPEPAHEVDSDLAEIGARLTSAEFLSCTACHAAGSTPALAPFGAPGINFAVVPARLRHEYYLRWLDNPQRVEPATRMPRFTAENGKSLRTEILDGDAHAQWNAIREYLHQVMNSENPERK